MKTPLLLLLYPALALAHPHQWIDLRITPETDASGALIALHESWEFDPYTSEILIQRNKETAALAQFKKDIDQYFREQHGFTYSDTLSFGEPRDSAIDTSGGVLRYTYTLPLKQPARGMARFKVYENSYYMDVTYALDQPKSWDNGCTLTIREAKPSAEEEELAQTSELQCGTP